MEDIHERVISAYVDQKLSEMQIAKLLSVSPKKVREVLNKNLIPRRSRSEASRYYHITQFGNEEFSPKVNLDIQENC